MTKGVSITIEKNIPVAAGLAGGSSDAAATLRGLNRLWELGLSLDELAKIGSEIGSDVSFCVYGGTALAKGRGEIITHLPTPPKCWVILAKPTIGVSTADVYKRLQLANVNHPDVYGMIDAIEKNDYSRGVQRIRKCVRRGDFDAYPEVANIKEHMKMFGADAVLMSGSGPTVFGLVHESRMQRIYNGLRGFVIKYMQSEYWAIRTTLNKYVHWCYSYSKIFGI